MRGMLTIALGAAMVACAAGSTIAGDPPIPTGTSPSPQVGPDAGAPSSQGGAPLGSAGSTLPPLPGSGQATNPDGSPAAPASDGSGVPPGSGMADTSGAGAGAGSAGGGGAGADAGGFSPGLGGFGGGSGAPPGIIGDMQPISRAQISSSKFPNVPNPTPPPHINNGKPGLVNGNGTTSILFKLTGLKISDNQSPMPQDRFFYSFNYFDNLNASVDRHQLSPIQNLQVYHQLFGLEKTFLDGRASLGFRVPLNTISLHSTANYPGLGGSSTAPGDLSIFGKFIVYQQGGNLISGGLQVTAPTGPGAFGGNKYYSYFRDTQIQPFVGYLFTRDRFYAQGFESINVPTTSRDVTLLFTDVAIGYYAYRAVEPNKFLTAIVPTAEAHLTTPLNHRGFSSTDLASTPDFLNMTFGTNVEFRRRALVSVAYVTPVTGPKPFNAELVILLNVRFGGRNRTPLVAAPLAN